VRLQKFLAHAGVASRRRAEDLIASGRVRVNGRVVREFGTSVAQGDQVDVGGALVEVPVAPSYLVLHKPVKVLTTMRDPAGRRTVASLMPHGRGRLVPVGRLDYDTSGVLLLTDDGDLAHVLTHPRFGVEKTYRALVRGRLGPREVRHVVDGIRLDEGGAAPAKLRVVRTGPTHSEVDLTIHEGRNRQVRRMFDAIGHPVVALVRLRFGPIALGDLPAGHCREASEKELAALRVVAQTARQQTARNLFYKEADA
jgi:23S rRNA pseudouridine2605 synthase